MSARQPSAGKRKVHWVSFGVPALRRSMREGARALESYVPVYEADAAQYEAERSKWQRCAREAKRAAVILREAASIDPA